MITDAFFSPLLAAVRTAIGWLPQGHTVQVPGLTTLWEAAAKVDSLIPIMGPLTVMLGLLAAAVVFVAVRILLTIWNLIYP